MNKRQLRGIQRSVHNLTKGKTIPERVRELRVELDKHLTIPVGHFGTVADFKRHQRKGDQLARELHTLEFLLNIA